MTDNDTPRREPVPPRFAAIPKVPRSPGEVIPAAAPAPAPGPGLSVRRYMAARPDRLAGRFAGLLGSSMRVEARQSLRGLVAHARHAAQNVDYLRSFEMMVRRHVVGRNGIVLQMDAREPDGRPGHDGKRADRVGLGPVGPARDLHPLRPPVLVEPGEHRRHDDRPRGQLSVADAYRNPVRPVRLQGRGAVDRPAGR